MEISDIIGYIGIGIMCLTMYSAIATVVYVSIDDIVDDLSDSIWGRIFISIMIALWPITVTMLFFYYLVLVIKDFATWIVKG